MNKFFKKIKEAYPKCVLHDDKNYLNFSIGASIVYQLRIQKDVIRIMAWNYPKKLKFGEAFKVIKAEKIESKKVNGEFKIMFEAGVKNPEIFTLRIEIPYKQSYLTKDEFINEIIKACEQFHLRLMPLINAFQTEPVDKLSKLMSLGNTFLKEEKKVSDKKENNFKKSNVDKSELNDDIAKNFRDSYEDEEDLAGAMILLSDDFSENGKIVVLEIKEKDLIKVTNNQDLLSGSLFSVLGVVGIKSWQALSKLIGNDEAEWVKNEFKDENPKSIVLLYCNGKYVYAYSDPNDDEPVNDIDEAPVAESISNISTQQELLFGVKNIYKDAEAKKIDIDNFLDIYIPSINPAKGTHLFFNTSKGVIKIGYYVRDEKFINLILEKTSKLIEVASNGLRIPGNPEFTSVNVALMAAKTFLSAISQITSKTTNSTEEDSKKGSKLTKTANKIKTSSETKKSSTNDIVDDFNNAVKSFKSNNLEAVANYVQAGNPGMQFSNDNGVIDNFLIAMTSGGNLNKDKLDLYLSKGLDINATTSDADAYTACHFAAWDGNDDVLKMLIDAGADPDVKGADTITPLNLSSANGHLECVKLLVSSGANIENRVTIPNNNHSEKGGTALRDAVLNLLWDVSDFLIKSGASVDVFNETCSNGEDFFSVVKRIILGQDNKENNLIKLGALEKKYNKKSIAIKPSKKTDLAPHVKDEKYASLALSVLLEIALDLAGGSKIVPASLYDAGILSERYNGIIGVPSAVIICSGFLEDDVLTMDDFKDNYPTIVNEVRDWFINESSIDINILIPSIKNCIKTIAKEWDDYMRLHGKLLCDSIKKLANQEGLASEEGMMIIQLVLDGLNISEEDWESNGEEEEVDEDEQEVDEEEEIEEDNDENIEEFLKNNFDIDDSNDVKNICNRIINDKVLPHLPYINDALASKDYEIDNHKAHFFAPHVYVSDKEMQGFLFVNMDGFYSNCVDLYTNQMIFSWSGVDDIKFKKTKTGCTIDIINEKGILTIKQEGIASLEILYVLYKNIWKLINDRFANEPMIMWNEVDEMGINRKAYFSHENYINDIEGEIEDEIENTDPNNNEIDYSHETSIFYCENVWDREDYAFDIQEFPPIFKDKSEINLLFRKFTSDEVDLIVNKIQTTKSYIILPFVSEMLKRKMNINVKPPFWFIPLVGYGNNSGSILYFCQDGIFNSFTSPYELSNTCHVDLWQEVSVESGYNGLFEDQNDDDRVSSFHISWHNQKSGNNGDVNIVEFHGEEYGSTLRIVKAIWENAWKEVVDRSRETSEFLLGPPPNIESFNSWDDLLKWASDIDSDGGKVAKKAVPKVKKNDQPVETKDDEVNESIFDFSESEVPDFDSNSDKYYKKELKRYLEITERTGILTNDITSQPTDKEREELWNLTQVFLDRIYALDREENPNQHELNCLCYYSIVALHWCDIYVTDKRFSYENGRFRRDTIALALCLSTRIAYNFEQYEIVHRGFILPHIYFSVLLWTIKTMIVRKEDVFFNKYSTSDAEKALQLFIKLDLKNQQSGSSGFIDMKQVPKGHPLLSIWKDLIKLFINERPPFNFILNYISHGSNHSKVGIFKGLFGGNKSNSLENVTLSPKDLDANIYFLNQRIENIAFDDSWPFINDILFITHYMVLSHNKTISKNILNLMFTKTLEWAQEFKLEEIEKNYRDVVTEYDKNHTVIRLKYILGKIYKYWTLLNPDNDSERDKQLRLVIGDLLEVAKSDTSNTDKYFDFIMIINNYWGRVLVKEPNEEEDEENSELGLPVIDFSVSEEKIVNIFLKESSNYNRIDNIEARLPKWMKSVVSPTILTPDQINILSEQIKKNKAIPVLKYAPKEFFNFVKSVWWFVPVAIWKEDVLSLIVVDKNGLNSIAFSDTTEISLISPFDRLTEYTLDRLEPTIERLTLIFDNGAFQTFDFFVDEGENGYLSIIAAILDVRMTTINKSKKTDGWKEGAGGEGFIQFDNVAQLYDLKYWKKTEISRPDPRFFG